MNKESLIKLLSNILYAGLAAGLTYASTWITTNQDQVGLYGPVIASLLTVLIGFLDSKSKAAPKIVAMAFRKEQV